MKRVLVFGDIIIDRYTTYRFKKMCPDRPEVPAYVRESIEDLPGGAANVAANLASLFAGDGEVHLIGAASSDALRTIKLRTSSTVNLTNCVVTEDSLCKERISVLEEGMICRLDNRSRYGDETIYQVWRSLVRCLTTVDFDAVVISDYAAGLYDESARDAMHGERLYVDTKERSLSKLNRPHVLKLNEKEYSSIEMFGNRPPEAFADNCIVTLGKNGAELRRCVDDDSRRYSTTCLKFAGVPAEEIDVTGCGDTFLAGLVFHDLMYGLGMEEAVIFANKCAASVVEVDGTSIVNGRMMRKNTDEVR